MGVQKKRKMDLSVRHGFCFNPAPLKTLANSAARKARCGGNHRGFDNSSIDVQEERSRKGCKKGADG